VTSRAGQRRGGGGRVSAAERAERCVGRSGAAGGDTTMHGGGVCEMFSWLGFQHVGLCGPSWAADGFIVHLKKSSESYIGFPVEEARW
jgi:hypothetical protein